MRVVHMTDVHFFVPPTIRGAMSKRALGLANLYVAGRVHYFDASDVVREAVADALDFRPDLFVLTGDVSAMSTHDEFQAARDAFGPLLESVPSVVIPGNHDRYTRGAVRDARMERYFGPWMQGGTWDPAAGAWVGGTGGYPTRFRIGGVDLIATDPCRAHLRSSGRYPDGAIAEAEALVGSSREAGQQVLYLMHYPPLWGDGTPYDRPGHCLADVHEVLASFDRAPPDLVLHGHKHECWRTDRGPTAVLNCGTTSARSPLDDRAAGYFVIELKEQRVQEVRRRILKEGSKLWQDHPSTFGT